MRRNMTAEAPEYKNLIPPHAWRNIPSVLVQFCQYLQNKTSYHSEKLKEVSQSIERLDTRLKTQSQQVDN